MPSIPFSPDITPGGAAECYARSFCIDCDAPAGGCDHAAYRYLLPYAMEPIHDETGVRVAWGVPELERWRADHPPSRWPHPARSAEPVEAEPLDRLIVLLEAHVDLDHELEELLREAYAEAPLKTSRLVSTVVEKASSRSLRSPAGLLVTRLKQVLHR